MVSNKTFRVFHVSCFCFLVASLFTFPSCANGQSDELSRSWNRPVTPYRIIGNIYYVGASDITSFLIVTPKGHILLDGGLVETVPQIQLNIAQLGFRLKDVKILINSHAHYDHAGGLAPLKRLTGARLMATGPDAELLARGGKSDFHFGDRLSYAPIKTDRVLQDGDKVELGGVTMVANLTPGHTKGCTTWTMKVQEGSTSYDVVFVGSTTVPGYKLVNNPNYPTIVDDYELTFQRLKTLPCDVFLASHGAFFSMLEKSKQLAQGKRPNPFIDQQGYKRFIEDTEAVFRKQLEQEQGGSAARALQSKQLVEKVLIVGHRRLTTNDILGHIKTRPGEPFSAEMATDDLEQLFKLGVFDKLRTRVITDSSVSGGVIVIFEVVELPLLSKVKFKGLRGIEESEALQALRDREIHLEKDAIYDSGMVGAVKRILEERLSTRGWPNAVVTVRSENSGTYASVEIEVRHPD